MHILPKIAICSLAALMPAAVNAHSARAAERVLPAGVAANSVVLGGQHALGCNWDAAREQVHVWRNVSADDAVIREITMERHRRPEQTVRDDQLALSESWGARSLTVTPLQVDRESVKELADLSRTDDPLQTEIAGTAAVAQPLPNGGVLDEWDEQSKTPVRSAEVPLLAEGLSGMHGLVALTLILITAFRMDIWRALNQAIFLWTAQPHGVSVVASGYRRRSRRRSSRWTWKSRGRGSNWSPGSRPLRRRSRRRSHSRRRPASQPHSTGSAAPRYRRGGREYVVADVVFTNGGSVYGSATPPAGGLLTFSND